MGAMELWVACPFSPNCCSTKISTSFTNGTVNWGMNLIPTLNRVPKIRPSSGPVSINWNWNPTYHHESIIMTRVFCFFNPPKFWRPTGTYSLKMVISEFFIETWQLWCNFFTKFHCMSGKRILQTVLQYDK